MIKFIKKLFIGDQQWRKDRLLDFIVANPSKWRRIVQGSNDIYVAIKLLDYYQYRIDNFLRVLREGLADPRWSVVEHLRQACRDFLGKDLDEFENDAAVVEAFKKSDGITMLNLSDDEFYLWLCKDFLEHCRKEGGGKYRGINPFNREEMTELESAVISEETEAFINEIHNKPLAKKEASQDIDETIQELVKEKTREAPALFKEAVTLEEAGWYDEAVLKFKEASSKDMSNTTLQEMIGRRLKRLQYLIDDIPF